MNDTIYVKEDDTEVIEFCENAFKLVNGDLNSLIMLLQDDFGYTNESAIKAMNMWITHSHIR